MKENKKSLARYDEPQKPETVSSQPDGVADSELGK